MFLIACDTGNPVGGGNRIGCSKTRNCWQGLPVSLMRCLLGMRLLCVRKVNQITLAAMCFQVAWVIVSLKPDKNIILG